ncbi:bacillithiol transferase BstA [Paenibacillus sp. LHD-117]|uniref:YfiT family bacillithiol transferase n=1 Tax=Paenibacillus sp. LHD-117 TaxID=3071412 RepID=UPI0027E0C1B8|nr:bacillithiol transferase BstA [Paenibacillus sp. LHD-117]MDQ6421742.1 bacillithiol transferase BstA [Paenibacillus sp. LHD-117]
MDLRYPIGQFAHAGDIDAEQREAWIRDIAELPALLKEAVKDLSEEQLNTPYRDGGWQVRQVVHHIADSHMNSLIRFKLALTEEHPTIRPYYEERWAELADTTDEPIDSALELIDAMHRKWITLLRAMSEEQFARTFYHPGSGETVRLDTNLGIYSWHGRHHLSHITRLADRSGWK